MTKEVQEPAVVAEKVKEKCFIIMPISDQDGYEPDHFKRVFEDIYKPACEKAGYLAYRADYEFKSNFIQLEILEQLLKSPIAICDLSGRNPNVLYELGFRQAFDKPTVLVKDYDTKDIFDINIIRYQQYHKELLYINVVEAQNQIATAITDTLKASKENDGINSLVRLLAINKAEVKDFSSVDGKNAGELVLANINQATRELNSLALKLSYSQANLFPSNNFLTKLDSFDKAVAQFENSINSKLSITILRSMYDGLNSEYYQLQNLIQPQSTWYSTLISFQNKLQMLYNKMMTSGTQS